MIRVLITFTQYYLHVSFSAMNIVCVIRIMMF